VRPSRSSLKTFGRAPVAEQLEDLETALGEQIERRGGVPLQEQRVFGRQQHGPGNGRDPGQLRIVELDEEPRGAQVEQGLTAGFGHRQEYIWRSAAPAAAAGHTVMDQHIWLDDLTTLEPPALQRGAYLRVFR